MSNTPEDGEQGLQAGYGPAFLKLAGPWGLLTAIVLIVVSIAGYIIVTDRTILSRVEVNLAEPKNAEASARQEETIQATIRNHELLIRNQGVIISQHDEMIKRNTDIMETMEAVVYMMSLTDNERRKIRMSEPIKIQRMRER